MERIASAGAGFRVTPSSVGEWLAGNGATQQQLQRFFGHASPHATMRYLRMIEAEQLAGEAVTKLEDFVAKQQQQPKSDDS